MESNAEANQDVDKADEVRGYLDIKVPASSRGRRTVKAWRRRWIEVRKCSEKVTLRVYISDTAMYKQEPPLFKKEINPKQAVIFRSQSKTRNYAFSIAEQKDIILHFSATSETESQKWMEKLRNMLWPPSDVLLLEKVLSGVHEVSLIDNEFTQRAGLLGSYGYLRITNTKIILIHPNIGHVIQEWYLTTLCRFQLLPTPQKEDTNRIFSIETGSNSSTGKGMIYFYSKDALEILQSIGSVIQQMLERRKNLAKTKAERQQHHKDLEELEVCLRIPEEKVTEEEDYYQVPRKEIRSVLDIPNFTFDKPLGDFNPELQLRTHKDSVVSQRKSCPEMNNHIATKFNRLSLNIPEELAVHPEFVSEATDEANTTGDKNSSEIFQDKITEIDLQNASVSATEESTSEIWTSTDNEKETEVPGSAENDEGKQGPT